MRDGRSKVARRTPCRGCVRSWCYHYNAIIVGLLIPMGLSTIFMPKEYFPKRTLLARVSVCLLVAFFLSQSAVAANSLSGLGRVPDDAELTTLTNHVFADGRGLPQSSGDSEQWEGIYASLCAGCHGSEGQGGSAMELVGDRSLLKTEYSDRGIAVYWPYAPTLFVYITEIREIL